MGVLPTNVRRQRGLQPFLVLFVVLLFCSRDPVLTLDPLGISLKLFGDLLDVLRFPSRNLDKCPGAQFLELVGMGRPNPVDFFQIVRLDGFTASRLLSDGGGLPGPILAR